MALFCYKNDGMPIVKDYYTVSLNKREVLDEISNFVGLEKAKITDKKIFECVMLANLYENYLYDNTQNKIFIIDECNKEVKSLECDIVLSYTTKELWENFQQVRICSESTTKNDKYFLCGMNMKEVFLSDYFFKCYCFLNVDFSEDNIILQLVYDINRLYQNEIICYLERLKSLIKNIFRNAETKIWEIELESNPLKYYSFKKIDVEDEANIITKFKKNVKKYLNRPAVCNKTMSFSYYELDELSDKAAIHISRFIEQSNAIIAIYSERSIEYVILILAVLKLGCTFMPIDKKIPIRRINSLINKSGADIVVTNIDTEIEFNIKKCFIALEDIMKMSVTSMSHISENRNAYVLFTSGTTGEPKGVLISHDSVVNMEHHFREDLNICFKDIIGQFASISFDASISEIFMALFSGACIYVYSNEEISNTNTFVRHSNTNGVTVITLPPLYSKLLDFKKFKTLRLLITAGTTCSVEQYEEISRNVAVINAYGPTECTVCATTWYNNGRNYFYNGVPIGKAIPGARVYVLGQRKNILPPYVLGEIYIAGNNVGKGYINNISETDKNFLPDIIFEGQQMYRTGDCGRLLPDGNIEFWGRVDEQVKINGIRVDLFEIVNIVETIPGVTGAYMKVVHEKTDMLCLYYTSNEEIEEHDIRDYLTRRLPLYCIPNHIIQIKEFVLNSSGKIDGSLLPSPVVKEVREIRKKFEFEDIFEESLGTSNLNLEKNFFEVGGSSLCCIKIVSELYERFGINIDTNLFLQVRDLRRLFSYIQDEIMRREYT